MQFLLKSSLFLVSMFVAGSAMAATMNQTINGVTFPNIAVSDTPVSDQPIEQSAVNVEVGDVVRIGMPYNLNAGPAATNVTARIDTLNDRSYSAGQSITVSGSLSGGNYSSSAGSVTLNFTQNVRLVYSRTVWEKQDCSSVTCGTTIGQNSSIGTVENTDTHYKGSMVAEYRVEAVNSTNPTPNGSSSCSINGVTIAHGSSYTFYNSSSALSCTAQARTCNNGVLSGSNSYQYTSCTATSNPTPNGSASCSINGVTIAHGSSYTFYNSSSALSCTAQARTCNNGVLSGSNSYQHTSCTTTGLDRGYYSSNGDATVDTDAATNVDDDSARLNGEVDLNNWSDADVYFQWGTSYSNLPYETPERDKNSDGDFDYVITNLKEGRTYYFRAVAEDNGGDREYGDIRSFRTEGSDSNDYSEASTFAASSVDEDSARLNGFVSGDDNTDVWFAFSRTDSTPSCSALSHQVGNSRADHNEAFNKTMTGLRKDTRYYYRSCAEDRDGDIVSGSVISFTTGGADLAASTGAVAGVTANGARMSATIEGDNRAVCYFQYGRTSAFGGTTNRISVDLSRADSCSTFQGGLASGSTYYYRGVIEQNGITRYGNTRTFRTNTVVRPTTSVIRATTIAAPTSVSADLEITKSVSGEQDPRFDDEISARAGETVFYRVRVTNNTGEDLKDVVVIDRIPFNLELDSQSGSNDNESKEVRWEIDLDDGESRTFTTELRVREDANDGDLIISYASADHKDHEARSNQVEVEIEDVDTLTEESGNANQTATIIGAGIFPTDLIGWALLLLILAALVFVVFKIMASHNANARILAELAAAKKQNASNQ